MNSKLFYLLFVLRYVLVFGVLVVNEKELVPDTSPKYTVEQLLEGDFPKKTSEDIYLDPCKAGKMFLNFYGEQQCCTNLLHEKMSLSRNL